MYKISQQYCELPLHLAAEPGVKPRSASQLVSCYLLFLDTAVPNWNNKQKKAMHAHAQPSWHKKAAAQAAGGTNTSSARNLSWAQTHPTVRVLEVSRQHGTARHGASLPELTRSQSHPWIMCNCAPFATFLFTFVWHLEVSNTSSSCPSSCRRWRRHSAPGCRASCQEKGGRTEGTKPPSTSAVNACCQRHKRALISFW